MARGEGWPATSPSAVLGQVSTGEDLVGLRPGGQGDDGPEEGALPGWPHWTVEEAERWKTAETPILEACRFLQLRRRSAVVCCSCTIQITSRHRP